MREPLPEVLPIDPLPLVARWIEEAAPVVKSATAMTLATVAADGRPTARMVVCRGFDAVEGWLVFYTDRESAKGQALERNPRAAVVFHWDVFERQVRVEGPVTRVAEADSERYWNTRPLDARLAAAASEQSRPIASRAAFLERIAAVKRRHGTEVPRPPHWGGYRVWAERVELWVGQPGRAHDRAAWTRDLQPTEAGFTGGSWRGTRLQP
jgi:pyridoxamine 5'-phosphate oxidase